MGGNKVNKKIMIVVVALVLILVVGLIIAIMTLKIMTTPTDCTRFYSSNYSLSHNYTLFVREVDKNIGLKKLERCGCVFNREKFVTGPLTSKNFIAKTLYETDSEDRYRVEREPYIFAVKIPNGFIKNTLWRRLIC